MPAFQCCVKVIITRTGTGVQTVTGITDKDGNAFIGKLVLFQSGDTLLNTVMYQDSANNAYVDDRGADDGTKRMSRAMGDISRFGGKIVSGGASSGYSLIDYESDIFGGGNFQGYARVTAFRSGEVDITFDANNRDGRAVLMTVLGGSDFSVDYGSGLANGTVTTASQPVALFNIGSTQPMASGSGTATGAGGDYLGYGWDAKDSGRGTVVYALTDQGGNARCQRTDRCGTSLTTGGSVSGAPYVSSWDANSLTIANNPTGLSYTSFAISGSTLGAHATAITLGTTTGEQATVSLGIKPRWVVLASTGLASATTATDRAEFTIGMTDGVNQGCFWCGESTSVPPLTGARYLSDSSVLRFATPAADTTTFSSVVEIVSLSDEGDLVLNQTVADGTARHVLIFAIGEALTTPPEPPVCSGGGEIPDTPDPLDAANFVGRMVKPRAWLTIDFDDASRSYALDTINTTEGRRLGYLLSFGSITYNLTDRFGAYRMASASVESDDASRHFSALEADPTTTHWGNRDARIYVGDADVIAAGGSAQCLWRGIWRGYTSTGLRHSLTFAGRLGSVFSDLNFDQKIPSRTIRDDFTGRYTPALTPSGNRIPLDTATLDLPVPIAYGRISDHQIIADESRYLDHRRGKVSPIYVGIVTCQDGTERHEFVVCGSAVTHFEDAFHEEIATNNVLTVFDVTSDAVFTCPDSSNWASAISSNKWVTYGGRTYTTVYLELGTIADSILIDKTARLTLNFCAIEDVGDATGNTITRAPRVIWHLLNNWVIRQYTSGTWLGVPTSPDGIPWLNAQSFRAMETWEYPQVGGEGYEFAIYLDQQRTVRDILQKCADEGGFFFGENLHGQQCAFHIPSLTDLSTVETLRDVQEIQPGTSFDRPIDQLENQVLVDWDYRPADQSYGHIGDSWDATAPPAGWVPDPTALDAANGRLVIGDRRQLQWAYWGVQVTTIAAWALQLGKRIPRLVSLTGPLHWIRVKLGTLVKVTDAEGIGVSGWTAHPIWVTGVEIQLRDLAQPPVVTLSGYDMDAFYTDTLGGTAAIVDETDGSNITDQTTGEALFAEL